LAAIGSGISAFQPVHLVSNMLCLAVWGGALEKRIGTLYFTLIYFCSLLAGSLVTVLTHHTPFIGAGASGAVSGVLGALLGLCILGKIELSLTYIVSSITINVIASVTVSGIDWRAHFGGFCAGLISCAVLDLLLSASRPLFWCKIPEFIKLTRQFSLVLGAFGFHCPMPDGRIIKSYLQRQVLYFSCTLWF